MAVYRVKDIKESKIADKIKANQDSKEMTKRAIQTLKTKGGKYKDLAKEYKDKYGEDPLEESLVKEDFSGDPDVQEYTTNQAKVLDRLSYLLSTEYEAVKWYDEALPEIKASGLDPQATQKILDGIKDIRKDEEDHIAHLEELEELVKSQVEKVIPDTTVIESKRKLRKNYY